ncbi:ABC transporter ATP-binding protein [Ferruginibacter yonginensis]|uniref:ABC transporter ATP-binding protein n=1 Tax=Ferruginibacter yonginensis TaxID=1310416 RepID=A0ABV8QWP0_9BACT
MAILSVDNLKKNYGKIAALKGVSFKVPNSCVYGILGPNGSGKTTLLGIIMNVLKASSGSYQLFGEPATDAHRKKIGTLLETPNFYHYLSAVQNLKITAAIKGLGTDDIEHVLATVDLLKRKDSPFSSYSLGMKQRLAIGAALLGNPDVLVFDEPTNGLDPVGIAEIRTLIKNLSAQGKTIIMASHLLDEVEKVCTHVAILKQGTLLTSGPVKEVFAGNDIVQLASSSIDALLNIVSQYPTAQQATILNGMVEVAFTAGTVDLAAINQYCFEKGIVLSHLQLKKSNFESKFLQLTNN